MNALLAGLVAASIILIQCLIGGTRLVFALPAYAIIALATLVTLARFRAPSARPSVSCLLVTALYFAYILARAAHSPWDYLWWQDFCEVLACLMVYGIFALYATSAGPRSLLLASLLTLAVAEFFIGLRQFRYADNWMPFGFIRGEAGVRASGTLISSIHFGGFLEAVGLFALSITFWGRSWPTWTRFLTGYVALLCYAGVAISGSRGAWLSSIVSLGVFALISLVALRKVRPHKVPIVLTVGGIVAVVVLIGGGLLMMENPLLQKRLQTLGNQDLRFMSWLNADPTSNTGTGRVGVDVRIYNWQAALDQIRLAPIWGTGAGTHTYYGRLFRRPQIQSDPIHAHSDYLEMLAEYGLIGLAGMVIFIAVHLVHGFRRYAHLLRTELRDLDEYEPARSDDLAFTIAAISAVFAYLAHSVVDFNLHIPGNALMFAFVFGVLASPGLKPTGSASAFEKCFRIATPALGLWMAAVGLPKYLGEYWAEKARVALRDGRLADSIQFAHRSLDHGKRNFELYFHLGEAERVFAARGTRTDRATHLADAIVAYQGALAIFPGDEHVLIRLAQAQESAGKLADAGESYRKALEHDPNLGVLHAYYAQYLFRVGREEAAHEQFKRAQDLGAQNLRSIVDPAFMDVPHEPATPGSNAK